MIERARRIYAETITRYPNFPVMVEEDGHRRPVLRLARPFDRPSEMPPHRWRVSEDVLEELAAVVPDAQGVMPAAVLFGCPVDIDWDAPAGTLELRPT